MQFRDLKRQYEVLKSVIDYQINEVINTSTFISGGKVTELEHRLAEYVNVKNCITCANGTDAITIALKVLGVGQNDVAFVPDFTFFSTGECPANEGSNVVFVDVDKRSFNIDPLKLEEAIINVKREGKYRPKVVISVDLFGLPADYDAIRSICDKYGLYLLEDGAQGFGGEKNNKKACSFGDISTTSFFPAKPLGCYGDGGAIFTNNDEWADQIRSICVHGKDTSNLNDPNSKYNNIRLGMNSRLDTIQAGVLLAKFDAFKDYELRKINEMASLYNDFLFECDIILPFVPNGFYSSWAQYTIQLPKTINRREIQLYLKKKEIPTMVYYMIPMHKQKAFINYCSEEKKYPITEELCSRVLSLPLHPYMTKEEVKYVADNLKQAIKEYV